ncbi:MAG: response regulator [Hyphomicrobiales bacterium]|nr:MAG: response regulator [Hyphomicrobiales bacterium]
MRVPLALIMEDEYLIASDIANGRKDVGFEVACVASERGAGAWLDDNKPDIAIVDIQLLDGQQGTTAGRLRDLDIPLIIHSGYDPAFQAPAFHEAPYLPKPASVDDLAKLASQLVRARA